MPLSSDILGLILGGGRGTRLYPLTWGRAKPAVPLAGNYRLIDIPMSNCFHAGIEKIAILTQFNSVSLHRHIYRTYVRDMFSKGWVQILPAELTPLSKDWYQGTADAVRKQALEIKEAATRHTLVLSGDQLYRMDYRAFASFHEASGADITVAVTRVSREMAPSFGIVRLDQGKRISEFNEKPQDPDEVDRMVSPGDSERPLWASMGIYLFRSEVLFELLEGEGNDFSRDILPRVVDDLRVMAYPFDGFWEDIGTIRRFYEVNLLLTEADPPFDFYLPQRPIYTRPRFLPGSEVHGYHLDHVLFGDGCRVYNAYIQRCVVGLRSIVQSGARLQNTVMMGADYYETEDDKEKNREDGRPLLGIGPGAVIEGAIIDKNARIGEGVIIRNLPHRPDQDHDSWVSRQGIVIVLKGAVIPEGTVI